MEEEREEVRGRRGRGRKRRGRGRSRGGLLRTGIVFSGVFSLRAAPVLFTTTLRRAPNSLLLFILAPEKSFPLKAWPLQGGEGAWGGRVGGSVVTVIPGQRGNPAEGSPGSEGPLPAPPTTWP